MPKRFPSVTLSCFVHRRHQDVRVRGFVCERLRRVGCYMRLGWQGCMCSVLSDSKVLPCTRLHGQGSTVSGRMVAAGRTGSMWLVAGRRETPFRA